MALTDNGSGNGMIMPVAPMYGGGYGSGFGGFGGDGWWVILFLFALMGNWGGFGGFGGGGFGNMMLGYDFPWLMNGQQSINANTNSGFQNAMLNDNITSIRDSIGDISTQLCNGFAGVEQGANARQIANMQQAFANQTAMNQGFNNVQSQLAQCCCENRLGTADLKYAVASEECATRANSTQNTQSILNLVNSGIQSIKDQLCQDKIDEKNETIAQLRQELLYSRAQDSQDVQTSKILAGQNNEVDQLYNRLSNCPVPTTPVYGRTPIFTCNNGGCGCNGMGGFNGTF